MEVIKNKKQIFPIIKMMTRELMDQQLPQNIIRKTVEPVTGDSLKRYQEIINIMVNEYGYRVKDTHIDKNKNMDESYEIGGIPSGKQILKDTFDWVLPLLPKK